MSVIGSVWAQDIVYSDSMNYNAIVERWQTRTYGKIIEAIQESNVNSTKIKQEASSPISVTRISPIEALDGYIWKDKKGELLYDQKKQDLPPSWLVKGYLKKQSPLFFGINNAKIKSARCYNRDSQNPLEVSTYAHTSRSLRIFNNFYQGNYGTYNNSSYSAAGMVPYRNGLMITDPHPFINNFFYR